MVLCIVVFLNFSTVGAQSLRKPTILFSAPCASDSFNSFQVNFRWDAPLVNSDNEFILELSDADGNFDSPVQLSSVSDRNTTLDFNFNFSFPTTIRGENYRIRVRSTSPALTSPISDAFPAYYIFVEQNLIINGFSGTEALCENGTVTLSVDNFPGEPAYRWFRNRNFTPIPGETGPTITVTDEGFYFVEVDYGEFCSSATASNEIEVIMSPPVGIAINGPANVELCPGFSYQLDANVDDNRLVYRWFRDGNLINTPGHVPSISVDPADPVGTYVLEVEQPGSCMETSAPVVITVPDFNLSISESSNAVLLPGETIDLIITTDAIDPDFEWFKDGVIIAGETSNTLSVSDPGIYRARVTEDDGCMIQKFSDEVNVELPQDFNIIITPNSTYTECDNTSITLGIDRIDAVTSDASVIDVTAQLLNRFTYQWLRESQSLAGETGNTLPIPDASFNGIYTLNASLGSFNVVSNDFDVKLRIDQAVTISSDTDISCDGASSISISSNVTDANFEYSWFRDDILIASETSPTLVTNLTGTYRLVVTAFGCSIFSNETVIRPLEESLLTVDASEIIVIQEGGLRIVTASGADGYRWFNEELIEISNGPSVTLSEEGEYFLRANIGNCEITRAFTVQFQESFAVPNVISPNSDGINDLWIIPNRYAFDPDVQITIFGPTGETVFQTVAYQNNWPESNLTFQANKPVFYYKIVRGRETVKQGTITLIR